LIYDAQGNLERELTKSILAARTTYQRIYEGKQNTTRGPSLRKQLRIPFEGQSQECEFINRRWYWITWDNKRNDGKGCYTFNPTEDCIIAPKEHGLGTEEDHYREPKSEETLTKETKAPKKKKAPKEQATLKVKSIHLLRAHLSNKSPDR